MKRRTFLKSVGTISAVTILKPDLVFGYKRNSAVQVGIIGCGNRGTAVITSMSTHTNTNIIAMADLFADKLQTARPKFNQLNTGKSFAEIKESNIYQGSKAYQQLINNKEVDAVLISSPAYTHPPFLEAAVAGGKHVYCEKPVAPDTAGVRRVMAVGEKLPAKQSLVIGFQIRYATPYVQMVQRIQEGAIGDIINVQLYYFSSGHAIREFPNVSDDEFRIRNQYHFNALSGGILLDQGIHMLDVCNWGLKSHALSAIGTGGTKGGPAQGDAWNNFQVLYQYPNDIKVSIHSTQIGPSFGDVCCRFIGTKGMAEAHYSGGVFIVGENPWDSGIARSQQELTPAQQAAGVFLSSLHDADANKELAFIKSIETGNHLNEAKQGAESTLTAILGREAAAAGKKMTWDEVLLVNKRLDPKLNLAQFDPK